MEWNLNKNIPCFMGKTTREVRFLVADHTVSPMFTLNWNVFCYKLAELESWPWGSASNGQRRVVIPRKVSNVTEKLLPKVTQCIFCGSSEASIVWIVHLVLSHRFVMHILGGYNLVRLVHCIHVLIVHCQDLRLKYLF